MALLAAALGAAHASAQAPLRQPGHSVASWTVREGLPVNTLLDVFQGSDGYLWLATYEGLVRFDGVRFTSLSPNAEGIAGANIWRIYQDREGILWAAANGGVLRYERGRLTSYTPENGLPPGSVRAVLRDRGGTVWAGTSRGVARLEGDGFVLADDFPGSDPPSVGSLAEDGDGGLWIGSLADGLFHYRAGVYRRLGTADGLPNDRVSTLLRDRTGTLWIGTAGVGVGRLRGGVLARLGTSPADAPLRVQEIVEDGEGTIWIGADNGLFRIRGDVLEPVPGPDGEPFTLITGLHADAEGSVWLSTHRAGLHHLRAASVQQMRLAEGVSPDVVYAVAGDGEGGVWVGTRAGLLRRAGERMVRHGAVGGEGDDRVVRDVLTARNGDLWLATFGGLRRLRDGRVTTYTTRDGLADDLTRVLLEDAEGAIWVGSFNGLTRLHRGRFRRFDESDGLLDRYVLALHEDRRGAVWISTQSSGLLRFQGDRVEAPAEVAELAGAPVFRIHEDPDGTLWIGSTRGLAVLREGRLTRITQAHGLSSNTIFHLLEDDRGYFWLGSNRGVIRVARSELEAIVAGRATHVRSKLFGSTAGLPAHDVTAVSRPWKAPDGTLWFPTPAGVARIDPDAVHPNRRIPQVHVEAVRVNGQPLQAPAGTARLAPGVHRLEIDFTGIAFVEPAQTRFRYQLVGFDDGWVEGGGQRTAVYTNLPPGSYSFRVIASNEDGLWNEQGAVLPILVLPRFYQSVWFVVLAALALVAGAVLLHLRGLRQVRRLEQEAEREAARRRMHAILESVTDSFLALDGEWRLTYVNAAAERELDRPRAELIGVDAIQVLRAAAGEESESVLRRAASEKLPGVAELPSRLTPGRWLEIRAFPTAEGLSVYLSDITGRKEAEESLRSLSMTDPLTGLHNRRGLMALAEQRLRVAREQHRELHIVFIDLDGMKAINDTFGHPTGDQAITDTAEIMRRAFRETDVLARLGGDEFAALVALGDGADPALLCRRLRTGIEAHNETAGRPYTLRVSIGTSRFDPIRPVSIERLLAEADREMYLDKRGKGDQPAPSGL